MKTPTVQIELTDELRVRGTLYEDAKFTVQPGIEPVGHLSFEIHPSIGLPYRVHQSVGTDPSAHIAASAKARTLRRGTAVQVYAKGLRSQTDHGVAALVLMGVTGVYPVSQPARTEATTEGHGA